ncbi:oligopeptide-binding protein AliB [Streptococcus pneumoniae]|nr:oligopeptide-binding protein AliB [Streptococcus pneumoniae]
MKKSKSKYLTLAGFVLGTGVLLSACGNSSTASKTYNYVYSSDPSSLNYLAENRATTNDIVTNLVDGLMENDQYGNYVPSLAEDWTVSQDGLTYTYKLRKDAKWFTSEGEEYAPVTAQDFVTGLQYAADKKSEALYLVQDSVAGLDDYITGKTSDFSTVGIKALDDQTVQYTLARPEPYWNSKTTSTILFPVNADFLKSKGDDFGKVDPANILYSGPFLMKAFVSKSVIEYKKNPNYWDAKNVFVDDVKLTYYDGSDQDAQILRDLLVSGADQVTVQAKKEEQLQDLLTNRFEGNMAQKIQSHLADSQFSLKSLASDLGFSPTYLSSLIKKELGLPFQDYLVRERVKQAKLLLLTTDLKIYEIAEKVGFEDMNYFTQRFKQIAGVTPRQFKKGEDR